MSFLQALLFGILQAVTEFFPVSSSAHLKIFKHLLGLSEWDNLVLFDLSCHLGTLIAVIYFLRSEIRKILKERNRILLFFIALLPLVPCYFLLKPLREWASQKDCLGFCLFATGLILLAGQFLRMKNSSVATQKKQIRDVLWIGTMQSAALIPGISRSASTISCARILGWDIKEAVRFSFLLSIPTIIGGNALELLKTVSSQAIVEVAWGSCLTAFASSFIVGMLIVRGAIQWLERGNFKPFAWYCMILGASVILYFNVLGL
jgi:undecaprenyl-diphosphatase